MNAFVIRLNLQLLEICAKQPRLLKIGVFCKDGK